MSAVNLSSPSLICTGPKAVLSYLRAQLRKAERCKLMKMIIVGPPRQGKSTLLEILQTGRAPQVVPSEATIRTTKWELQRPAGCRAKVKDGWCAESPRVAGSGVGHGAVVGCGRRALLPPPQTAQRFVGWAWAPCPRPREFTGAARCSWKRASAKGSRWLLHMT